jgi:hypothetical protein
MPGGACAFQYLGLIVSGVRYSVFTLRIGSNEEHGYDECERCTDQQDIQGLRKSHVCLLALTS